MAVSHKQIFKPGAFGGVSNTTLCGRVDNSGDDMNVDDKVTCKICRDILSGVRLSARTKWIGWTPPNE